MTLAGTSVGRGWDCVGHRAGTYSNRIGIAARQDLERFFETRVYLELQVRVRSEWREDDRVLQQLGLGPK